MKLLFSLPNPEFTLLIYSLLIIPVLLIPKICYLDTLQNTLKAISVENRKMPVTNVWLLLIPFFATVLHFFIVDKMAQSIYAEAVSKNIAIAETRPAYTIGLAMCILNCLFIIPVLNVFAMIAYVVCWIIYWTKIAAYKNELLKQLMPDDFLK